MTRGAGKGRGKGRQVAQDAAGEAMATSAVPAGLTQVEVAARVPCSRTKVQGHIARGDITPDPVTGLLPESAVDFIRAHVEEREDERDEIRELNRRLLAAQAGEREAKQQLRELELQRERGRFVELDKVERAGADAAQRILAVLRATPQRIALEVDAALSAPADRRAAVVEKIVSREIERAIAEMRASLFLQAGTDVGTETEKEKP